MKTLMKSVKTIGQVFGLVVGNNFTTTPTAHLLEEHPSLRFGS